MVEILQNKDIFIYLIEETNLFKTMIEKQANTVHHCIDELEKLVNFCGYPQVFLKVFNILDEKDFHNLEVSRAFKRIYREIFQKIFKSCSKDFFEQNIYKNEYIFKRFIIYLSIIDLIEAEGIYDILLNSEDPYIIAIFS